jgi:flavin-dependent dehydrogenase
MKTVQNRYDVIIIGAGPAGSSASAVLAQKGRRVLALEREKFPRYHIGESLIPYSYFPLERIGMIEKMKASSFPKKYSVQFVTPDGKQSIPFYFFKHLEHEASCTWQVVRGDFDKMLMENAREKGAEIHEETRATELLHDGDSVVGVKAVGKDGEEFEVRAPITIDATGRDAFSMMRNKWRVRDPYLNKIAVWTYYKGAKRDPGVDEGATTVAYVPEKGWFWYIPLPDDIISVGVVAEKDYLYNGTRDLAEIFQREVKNNTWIEEHLAQGTQVGEYRVTGEYSYRSKYCAADGLVLIGDAFAFLDPVFSSGVFLALRSGELAGDAVDAALDAQDYSAARFTAYGDEMRKGIEAMRRLVYTFYDHNFSFGAFLKKHPNFHGDITDCLIGNSHLDYGPMFEAISKFAAVPPPLEHGRPLLAHVS